jgi:hypothetical protein
MASKADRPRCRGTKGFPSRAPGTPSCVTILRTLKNALSHVSRRPQSPTADFIVIGPIDSSKAPMVYIHWSYMYACISHGGQYHRNTLHMYPVFNTHRVARCDLRGELVELYC